MTNYILEHHGHDTIASPILHLTNQDTCIGFFKPTLNLSIVIMMAFVIAVAITTTLSTPTSCQPRYENPLGLILPHTHLTLVTLVDDIPQPCLDPCPISRVHRQGGVWQAAESLLDTSASACASLCCLPQHRCAFTHVTYLVAMHLHRHVPVRHMARSERRRGRGSAQDGDT